MKLRKTAALCAFLIAVSSAAVLPLNNPEVSAAERPAGIESETGYPAIRDTVSGLLSAGTIVTSDSLSENKDTILKNYDMIKSDFGIPTELMIDQKLSFTDEYETEIKLLLNDETERFLSFAAENDIAVDLGMFIYAPDFPEWFFRNSFGNTVSREVLEKRLENTIKAIFDCLDERGCRAVSGEIPYDFNNHYGTSDYWTDIYGDESFVKDMFRYTRKYAPEGFKINYQTKDRYVNTYESVEASAYMESVMKFAGSLREENLIDAVSVYFDYTSNPRFKIHTEIADTYIKSGFDVNITYFELPKYSPVEAYDSDIFSFLFSNHEHINSVVFVNRAHDYLTGGMPQSFPVRYRFDKIAEAYKNGQEPGPLNVPGDINSDGKIDISDLSELSLALIGDQTLTENQVEAADINKNGKADLSDLARIRQFVSNVITHLR